MLFTDYFPCCVGMRQGEHLSTLLFSIFLNDLEESFKGLGCSGICFEKSIPGNIAWDIW